ncbi:hypothetical protein MACH21_25980 [Roseicyclus marinus]|uniref:Uncharacterized protein n=1 Tax=Roseicyclus marinus TaxID=2161673 RepID=A0AA48HLF9_9RHOB|nr:hypothetical protein MACH21_25980 [Roseicyclus marinus]
MIGVEISSPGAEDGTRAGKEMGLQRLTSFAPLENATHPAFGSAERTSAAISANRCHGLIRELAIDLPVHRSLKKTYMGGPERKVCLLHFHRQHRQAQLQLK